MDDEIGVWKSVEIKNASLTRSTLRLQVVGALDDVRVEGIEKKVEFNLKIQESKKKKIKSKQYKKVVAESSKPFQLPRNKKKS
jgi:hypothetical protein